MLLVENVKCACISKIHIHLDKSMCMWIQVCVFVYQTITKNLCNTDFVKLSYCV